MIKPKEPQWLMQLASEFQQPYMVQLQHFIEHETASGVAVFPPVESIFNALDAVPFDDVNVVIIGQDPYHGLGQAHGLSFSVPVGVKIPPSLVNIFKELERDLGVKPSGHGCLEHWAKQGVLLLNTVLTVEQGKAGSHQGRGWEVFTDKIIACLNAQSRPLVFMLLGAHAQKKGRQLDEGKHCVLKAVHPSPLSAYRGFIGCGHFSAANTFLMKHGRHAIDWQLPAAPDFGQISLL